MQRTHRAWKGSRGRCRWRGLGGRRSLGGRDVGAARVWLQRGQTWGVARDTGQEARFCGTTAEWLTACPGLRRTRDGLGWGRGGGNQVWSGRPGPCPTRGLGYTQDRQVPEMGGLTATASSLEAQAGSQALDHQSLWLRLLGGREATSWREQAVCAPTWADRLCPAHRRPCSTA